MTPPPLLANLGSTPFMKVFVWAGRLACSPPPVGARPGSSCRYHAEHVRRIGATTASATLAGLAPVVARLAVTPAWRPVGVLFAVVAALASTALARMPLHRRPSSGCDAAPHCQPVNRNWARTDSWSAHVPIVLMTALLEFI